MAYKPMYFDTMKPSQRIEKHKGKHAMTQNNTMFSQLLKLYQDMNSSLCKKQHHKGRQLRKMTRWSLFKQIGL
jgi:CII-binding regulator of phage lambda lysogenization HflD